MPIAKSNGRRLIRTRENRKIKINGVKCPHCGFIVLNKSKKLRRIKLEEKK